MGDKQVSEWAKSVAILPADADVKWPAEAPATIGPKIPIVLGDDGAFVSSATVDAIETTDESHALWQANSKRTRTLLACVHACKDIAVMARAVDMDNPWRVRRQVAILATPILSLVENTKALHALLGLASEERSHWPTKDLDLLRDASRRLKKYAEGPLRPFRNKLTAHVDADAVTSRIAASKSLAALLLPPFADALLLLLLHLNYRRVYTWKRVPIGAAPNEIEIMTEYPLALRVTVDSAGFVHSLGAASTLSSDPRGPLKESVIELFHVYNRLAETADPGQPTIYFEER
jgi:hypothetical protein